MKGIGGSTIENELNAIVPIAHEVQGIKKEEFKARVTKACALMKAKNIAAMYLNAGTNLYYFTGMRWNASERMVGAIVFQNGEIHFIAPEFEKGTILDFMVLEGEIHGWEEHESPYQLCVDVLAKHTTSEGIIALDESTQFFIVDGIQQCGSQFQYKNAKEITAACRRVKSDAEIAILQHAMNITLEVQKAAARILRVGISSKEVTDFIHQAHIRYGIPSGSYFCIVLFGVDSSFPHGVKSPKNLEENEVVLIDTGCMLHHYISDITRTYVFGKANELQQKIWRIEKEAQFAAFEASQLGNTCASVDAAVRKTLELHQLGPEYKLPGLPHRTGHGIGLDIHEWPYIVKNDMTILEKGMTFSNEPMICIPNTFGIRLEDHIYMTENGPKWFTKPMHTIENPFGY